MADAAGNVNVVLSMNAVTFTQGIKNAQAELDKFAGKSKQAGQHTVSSMQAASAGIRLLENPLGNNIRSIERLISQSQVLSGVMKAAFPVVGAIAASMIIGKLVEDVVKFVKAASEMPKAITMGFASLALASKSATDQLQLTNDLLQNNINKLENKPQNNQKIAIDESRVAMDKFAESIENSNNKLTELLSKNHLSAWHELMFTAGTADREGTAKYFADQSSRNAFDLANAAPGSPQEAAAKKALQDTQAAQLAEARADLQKQINLSGGKDTSAPQAIDRGIITNILNEQHRQAAQAQNGSLEAQNKAAEAAHAASIKAAEARKKAAEEFIKNLEADEAAWKVAQRLAEDMDKALAEHNLEFFKSNGLSEDDQKSLSQKGTGANAYITALRESITLNKQNADSIAEASLQMAVQTGQMTAMNAAQVLANMHTADYKKALQDLKDQRDSIANDPQYNNNPLARQAALQDNTNRVSGLNASRSIQSMIDSQATNPASSLASTGFNEAINSFVLASRDAAAQMRDLVSNTLSGLNQQIVAAISGQHTSFGNFGAGVARSVATTALQKGEGALLGAFGGGKLGTRANPMAVTIVGGAGAAAAGSVLNSIGHGITKGAGGIGGFFGGLLHSILPGFASGGSINGPAIVGENGPEIFNPGTSGTIIPNHKLVSGSGGDTHFHIDARGSTDPAQTMALVQKGIVDAAPHLMALTAAYITDQRRRQSPSAR